MSLKIVKNSENGAVSVMMDGKLYKNNALSVKAIDPKTVHIDLFIPPGDHNLQIKGIRNGA
jgi:ABC-type oligopeptide transport system substrate-binding subunit